LLIDYHVIAIVETNLRERKLAKFPDRVRLARGYNIIIRLILLQHQVHGAHVVFGVTPVAARVEVSQPQLGSFAEFYTRDGGSDLTRDKFEAAARSFMIEENAPGAEHLVSLAVIPVQHEAGDFADAIRRARIKRRAFALR